MCIYIYIYICIHIGLVPLRQQGRQHRAPGAQDSAKGGAAEPGCSDLYDVIY